MIAFLLSPVGRRIAAAVGAALLLLAAYAYVDHKGYSRGYTAAETKYTIEIAQMKAAAITARAGELERQAAVQEASKAREAQRIAAIEAENDSLEQKITELEREASEDFDALRRALSAAGVRRINQIR